MPHLTRFRVQGYRAISEPIELTGLGPYVALYGDNAVGKSSVLEAVGLLGRLCQFVNNELVGTGAPWQFDVFYPRFGQDEWMFHAGGSAIVLEGEWSDGVEVTLRLERQAAGIAIGVERVFKGGVDQLAVFAMVTDTVAERRNAKNARNSYSELEAAFDAKEERLLFDTMAELVRDVSSRASIQAFASPVIPVTDQIRNDFLSAWISKDVSRRKRARAVAATFGELFPALGPGQLEPAENTNKAKDVAWVNEAGLVPLDHLGGGVQSVFATLARLATTDARIACIDEPEAFVGERALRPLVKVFRDAPARGLADQIWIATHAVTLADDESPLFLLERENGVVRATRTSRAELVQLTPSVGPDPKPLSLGRLSLDGSVRLPESLRDRLGLKVGDFVHYVDIDDGGARIVSPAELERVLGSGE